MLYALKSNTIIDQTFTSASDYIDAIEATIIALRVLNNLIENNPRYDPEYQHGLAQLLSYKGSLSVKFRNYIYNESSDGVYDVPKNGAELVSGIKNMKNEIEQYKGAYPIEGGRPKPSTRAQLKPKKSPKKRTHPKGVPKPRDAKHKK